MFTLLSFPCVARRISQRQVVPVINAALYVGLYHTDPGLYLCEGGWLLHSSELYESIYHALSACATVVAERQGNLVECNVPTGSALGVVA